MKNQRVQIDHQQNERSGANERNETWVLVYIQGGRGGGVLVICILHVCVWNVNINCVQDGGYRCF